MTSGDSNTIQNHAAFIWSVADLLRGDYKQSEYGKVILPLTVLRRLDCVLEPTKQAVLDRAAQLAGRNHNLDPILQKEAGEQFYNTSRFDFATLVAAPDDLADNLKHYIASFSASARDVLDKFEFTTQIDRLERSGLLYLVVSKFAEIDLHPNQVSNLEMGYLYEELIRRFAELSNETAGEHFTPREVIRLMVDLLFIEDDQQLTKPGAIKTIYDGACGTGGMLSVAEDRLRELNPASNRMQPSTAVGLEHEAHYRSNRLPSVAHPILLQPHTHVILLSFSRRRTIVRADDLRSDQ
jgi:type I restriction enzyme M protein